MSSFAGEAICSANFFDLSFVNLAAPPKSNIAKSKSCTGFFGTDCIFLNKILSGLRSKCA